MSESNAQSTEARTVSQTTDAADVSAAATETTDAAGSGDVSLPTIPANAPSWPTRGNIASYLPEVAVE